MYSSTSACTTLQIHAIPKYIAHHNAGRPISPFVFIYANSLHFRPHLPNLIAVAYATRA